MGYPLVNWEKTMENYHFCWENARHFDWAILSIAMLAEGNPPELELIQAMLASPPRRFFFWPGLRLAVVKDGRSPASSKWTSFFYTAVDQCMMKWWTMQLVKLPQRESFNSNEALGSDHIFGSPGWTSVHVIHVVKTMPQTIPHLIKSPFSWV